MEWVEPNLPPTLQDEKFGKQLRFRIGLCLFVGGLAVWGMMHAIPEREPLPIWMFLPLLGLGVWLLMWLGPLLYAFERKWPTKVRVFQKRIVRVQGGQGSPVAEFRKMGSFYWVSKAEIFLLIFLPRKSSDNWMGGCSAVRVPDLAIRDRMDFFLREQGLSEAPDSERNHHERPVKLTAVTLFVLNYIVTFALWFGLAGIVSDNIHYFRPYGKYTAFFFVFGIPVLYFLVTYHILKCGLLRAEAASRRTANALGGKDK
jgi:hypothetical protein